MKSSLEAEWLKLTTTRAFYGLAGSAAVLMAFISFGLVAQGPPPWHVTADQVAGLGGVNAITLGLFGLIMGLRISTDEFRYGTIVHTAFSDPRHTRTSLAKGVVAAAAGTTISTASVVLTGVVVFVMTSVTGGSLETTGVTAPALGLVAGTAMWAVLGAGLGAVIRQPVPAVVTALLWVLVFENVAGFLIGPLASHLPGQAAQILARGIGEASDVPLAAGVMAAWAAALWLIGWTSVRRRDLA